MTSFFGNSIPDVGRACLNVTAMNEHDFRWMLTVDVLSTMTCNAYSIKIGTTAGGSDILNETVTGISKAVVLEYNLTSGEVNNVNGTVYYTFSVNLNGADDAHKSGSNGPYTVTDYLAKVTKGFRATVDCFGLISGTTDQLYATWSWNKESTDHYICKWEYYAARWFTGSEEEKKVTEEHISTYTIPANATQVRFAVLPVSTTYDTVSSLNEGAAGISYWLAEYSTYKVFNVSDTPPTIPSVPSISITDYKLTASLENIPTTIHATQIEFQIVKDDATVFNDGLAEIKTQTASYSCNVDAGARFKVRARAIRDAFQSAWSDYSSNVKTASATPSGIDIIRASSATSIYLQWTAVQNADSYDLEYATKVTYFDSGSNTTTVTGITFTHYEKTGLDAGEYFFRLRSVNTAGHSSWTDVKSVTIGKAPAAPSTWSSTTTVITGSDVTLYWIHNAKDGSSQTYAEVEVNVNGTVTTYTVQNTTVEEEKDKTSHYDLSTSSLSVGAKILWRVRTAGVTTVYGDWSVQRQIDVYAPATLSMDILNKSSTSITSVTEFPFYVKAVPGPSTQAPLGYHVSVKSNTYYETHNEYGAPKVVSVGEEIYARYFDTSDVLMLEMSASNIDLQNNASYTITVTVVMNSGLSVTGNKTVTVSWSDSVYYPNAEVGINPDTASAYIRPYCYDENDTLVTGVTVGVYRREYDGTFVEISTGLDNTKLTYVTDPHPSLDLARYRIVAVETATGAVSFCDLPGVPTNELGAILQWNEVWSNFEVSDGNVPTTPPWSGSMLRLLYNVDVSDKNSVDSSLVEYVGRKYPVSYYGTQIGSTSSWSVDVPKSDKETIYQLRRLAIWAGDVYVREPSGTGYWARVNVSFDLTHAEVLVPVTLDITRVEGGI